jgi:hypothetical protein
MKNLIFILICSILFSSCSGLNTGTSSCDTLATLTSIAVGHLCNSFQAKQPIKSITSSNYIKFPDVILDGDTLLCSLFVTPNMSYRFQFSSSTDKSSFFLFEISPEFVSTIQAYALRKKPT